LACHNYNDTLGRLPPAATKRDATNGPGSQADLYNGGYGNPFFHVLAFIEGGNLYNRSVITSPFRYYSAAYNYNVNTEATAQQIVKTYLCPSDPSAEPLLLTNPGVGINAPFAVGCYAFNFQVFGYTGSAETLLSPTSPPQLIGGPGGYFGTPSPYDPTSGTGGNASIPKTFQDGTTVTILFAEKYSRCSTTPASGTERGTLWAWWHTGYVYSPRFAWQSAWGTGAGPASKFLVRPTPFTGADSQCDGARASTSHNNINVVMADGSVRSLSAGLDATTWWLLCLPADGSVIGNLD
jgi:hypothetical protein